VTLARLPTGIPGLDEILRGGLMKAGVYLVRGEPGAGKTIFGNQVCFDHVATGGKAGYITLLAESHGRMLEHMEGFSFFRSDAIPNGIYYVSAFNALKDRGLAGVTSLISSEMRFRKIDMLVLDGLVTAAEAAGSAQDLKLFVSELQVYAVLMGCTVILLNSVSSTVPVTPEQTMVDGIFTLRHKLVGCCHERTLEVVKFRGSAVLDGLHTMHIDDNGIAVFPRLEAARIDEVPGVSTGAALASGVPGFDALSQAGGYPEASVTAIAGAPGSGKTLLGLHFVAQASVEEPALLFGCYESPALLVQIAASFGMDLAALRNQGALHIIWQPYGASHLDELGYRLLGAVQTTRCKRLFLDGLGAFLAAPGFDAARGVRFLATLANELRRNRVTTLIAVESEDPNGFALPFANHGVSAMADNVARVSIDEHDRQMRRLLSMGKVRGSRIALSLHELRLSATGLHVTAIDAAREGEG
jgi:circadian clock protein KaiC